MLRFNSDIFLFNFCCLSVKKEIAKYHVEDMLAVFIMASVIKTSSLSINIYMLQTVVIIEMFFAIFMFAYVP